MNIVDFILIGFLLIGAGVGWRNGFIVTVVSALSSILGLVAAYLYYDDLGGFLNEKFGLQEPLSAFLQSHLTLPELLSQIRLQDILSVDLGAYLDTVLPDMQFKAGILSFFEHILSGFQGSLQLSLGEIIHQYLASALISIAAFFIIWAVVGSILQLFATAFRSVIYRTFLGQVDSLAGLLVGGVFTALVLAVLLGLFAPFLNLANVAESSPFSAAAGAIAEARLAPYFTAIFNFLFSKFTIGTFV